MDAPLYVLHQSIDTKEALFSWKSPELTHTWQLGGRVWEGRNGEQSGGDVGQTGNKEVISGDDELN